MSDVKDWSKSAGGNTAASPDGAPEGMPPSGVNNTMRENMASIRREREDAEWFNYGETPTWNTSGDNFTLVGDQTTDFHVNRRVKCFDASVFYGTIISATYTASTRINVTLDSGALTASLTGVAVSILSYDNNSLPLGASFNESTTYTFAVTQNFQDANFALTASFSAVPTVAGVPMPFTKYFESAELALGGAEVKVAHSLGGKPTLATNVIVCKTAEYGYAIGEEVYHPTSDNPTADVNEIFATTASIGMSYPNFIAIYNRASAGNVVNITNGNWKLKLKAWR